MVLSGGWMVVVQCVQQWVVGGGWWMVDGGWWMVDGAGGAWGAWAARPSETWHGAQWGLRMVIAAVAFEIIETREREWGQREWGQREWGQREGGRGGEK